MDGYCAHAGDLEHRRSALIPLAVLAGAAAVALIFAQGLYGASVGNLPYIFLGAVAWILTFLDIRIGLGLTILAIGLSPEYTLFGVPNLRMEDFVFPAVLLAWLLRTLRRRERLAPSDLTLPIAGLVLVTVCSSLYNLVYQGLPFSESFFRFGKNLEYYLMFLVTLNVARTERDIGAFIQLLWATALTMTVYAIVQFESDPAMKRLHGMPGETANILGGYLVFHVCILLGVASAAERGRLFYLLVALVMAVPFVHTMSRASYVSIFFGLAVLGLLTRDRFVVLFLLCIGALIAFTQARDRFETIFGLISGTPPPAWQARIEGWKLLLPDVAQSPLLGWGIGRAPLAIDNEYVRQVYEQGLLGLAFFLMIMWRAGSAALRAGRTSPVGRFRGFAVGYLAGMIALLTHSCTAVTFTTIRTAEPFFIATGLVYAILAGRTLQEGGETSEFPTEMQPLRLGADGRRR